MLETLTHHDFAAYVGQTFDLRAGQEHLPLKLEEVKFLHKGHREDVRDQFSILFKGPASPLLPQQIYPLLHPRMGELALFLVPVGREEGHNQDRTRPLLYEAVFT